MFYHIITSRNSSYGKVIVHNRVSRILSMGGYTPRYACPPSHTCPLPGYYEMRSMSGRYASYWNAFLFYIRSVFFFIFKVEVLNTRPSILNLGLLQRIHDSTGASLKETQELLVLPQRVFQDFVGGFFISHKSKVIIEKLFVVIVMLISE